MVQPIALGLHACAARDRTEQYKIKSSTTEKDVIQRHSEHKLSEAVLGITWHTVLQHTFL